MSLAVSDPAADDVSPVRAHNIPQETRHKLIVRRIYAGGMIRWTGWERMTMDDNIIRHESTESMLGTEWSRLLHDTIMATPAANGNAIPARSLSTSISYRIFAKVAINFITLQR